MADNSNATRIVLTNVRLSYTYLAEPQYDEEKDEHSFATQILVQCTDKANLNKIKKAMQAAAIKKFGPEKAPKVLKSPKCWNPLRNPEDEESESFERPEYKGVMFLKAKTNAKKGRPGCILKNKRKLTEADEIAEHIYSGCYAHVSITCFAFDTAGNKGIAFSLNNVLKHADAERLDGSVDAEDDFDDDLFDEVEPDEFDEEFNGGSDDDWDL